MARLDLKSSTVHHFADFRAFLDAANLPARTKETPSKWDSDYRAEWTGSRDYAHSMDLALNGAPDLEADILRMEQDLTMAASTVTAPAWTYAVAGDDVDIERYLSGEPEHMIAYEIADRPGSRIVSLLVNCGFNSHIAASTVKRRGAAIMALANLMTANGYTLEIHAIISTQSYRHSTEQDCYITLKESSDALDITRLCYSIAHPSFLRRTWFSFAESIGLNIDTIGARSDKGPEPPAHDLYLSSDEMYPFESDASAKTWIEKTLAELTKAAE